MDATDLERTVAALFPPFVAVAAAPCDEAHQSHHAEEVALVNAAVLKRRREFLSGRLCAHQALGALGLDDGPILSGHRREPVWPEGAVGSITHAGGWSVAVAARATDAVGLGLDLELREPPLELAVDRLVRTPSEHQRHPSAGKLVFCVKETVFKCLFPLTGQALEFEDVDVALDFERGSFDAQVGPRRMNGRFAVAGDYVLSGLSLP